MPRQILTTIAFAFFLVIAGRAGAQTLTLNYFTAGASGSDVIVAWELPDENGVSQFKLFRKIEGEAEFKLISLVLPTGSRTYQYLDASLFKDVPKLVTYQLQVSRSGMVYSYYTTILYNPTSVQRTWGSIKAMFR